MSSLSTINNIVNQRNHYYYVNPMQWSSKFGIEEFKSSQRIPSETNKLMLTEWYFSSEKRPCLRQLVVMSKSKKFPSFLQSLLLPIL